jgi:hypothetical protein
VPLLALILLTQPCYPDTPQLIGTIHADTAYVLYGQDLVPLSDQNGDGTSELLVYNGNGSTYLFCGGEVFDSTTYMRFDSTNAWGGDLGDINGDGYADFALLGRSQYRWKMNVYFGGPLLDTVRDLWYGSDDYPPCLWPQRTSDLNRNGSDEVIIDGCMDDVQIYELDEDTDSLPDLVLHDLVFPPLVTGNWAAQMTLGDFNGDGLQDLAVAQTPHTSSSGEKGRIHVFWGGPGFDSVPDLTIIRRGDKNWEATQFGRVMTSPGDLNADGFDDLFVAAGTGDDTSWVYFGGAVMDTLPDLVRVGFVNHAVPAGDINRDGYDDLMTSMDWPVSTAGQVFIFYGGPSFDLVPDILINNWDDSEYQIRFGMAIAGLGDFNGDGVDDFAFSAIDGHDKGVVYIYSGTGEPTAVGDDPETIPSSFTLYQNYPNPFNPSTTISFELKRRSHVTLTILNMLGQEVAHLVNREMAAGAHSVRWDGTTDDGTPVASGVYLYRLTAGNFVQSRKMELVR